MVHCPGCQNKQKAAQSARWSDLRFLIKAATAVLSSPPKYLPTPPCLTVFFVCYIPDQSIFSPIVPLLWGAYFEKKSSLEALGLCKCSFFYPPGAKQLQMHMSCFSLASSSWDQVNRTLHILTAALCLQSKK